MHDYLRKGEDVALLHSLIAGGVSGLATRLVTSPLDVIKIRLQLQLHNRGDGVYRMICNIIRNEGIRGFWKGNVPGSIMYVLYGGVQFSTYSLFNNTLNQYQGKTKLNAQLQSFLVGGLSGITSSTISYPFDLLRTRFIANQNMKLKRIIDTIRTILNQPGGRNIKNFYNGCTTTIIGITISSATMFGTYETLRIFGDKRLQLDSSDTLGHWTVHSAGSISGFISKLVTFPIDTIRRHQQIDNLTLHRRNGISVMLDQLSVTGVLGLRQLYNGFSVALIKSVPATAVSLYTYEAIMQRL